MVVTRNTTPEGLCSNIYSNNYEKWEDADITVVDILRQCKLLFVIKKIYGFDYWDSFYGVHNLPKLTCFCILRLK